jgi:7-cyano-7-deazaguanine reductase
LNPAIADTYFSKGKIERRFRRMFKNVRLLDNAIKNKMLPKLETFPSPFATEASAGGAIRIVFPEFTCVCPRTGYPDFAKIHLYYQPDKLCLELKSWKLYLNSFRMIGAFHEAVTAHLFDTVKHELGPRWLMVIGDFFPRGNVDTTVVFETPSKRPPGVDRLFEPVAPYCRSFGPEHG